MSVKRERECNVAMRDRRSALRAEAACLPTDGGGGHRVQCGQGGIAEGESFTRVVGALKRLVASEPYLVRELRQGRSVLLIGT